MRKLLTTALTLTALTLMSAGGTASAANADKGTPTGVPSNNTGTKSSLAEIEQKKVWLARYRAEVARFRAEVAARILANNNARAAAAAGNVSHAPTPSGSRTRQNQ